MVWEAIFQRINAKFGHILLLAELITAMESASSTVERGFRTVNRSLIILDCRYQKNDWTISFCYESISLFSSNQIPTMKVNLWTKLLTCTWKTFKSFTTKQKAKRFLKTYILRLPLRRKTYFGQGKYILYILSHIIFNTITGRFLSTNDW